jgi:hypothetical protein
VEKAYLIREEVPLYQMAASESSLVASHMLRTQRRADQGNSLWTTFNVVQEKLIRGGYYRFEPGNGFSRARAIKSIPESVRVNTALHDLAQSYL